jgi:hypothetical protein
VAKLPTLDAGISIYNLLEICGLASFNLSQEELARWFYYFDQLYGIKVIFPKNLERTAWQFFEELLNGMYKLFSKKMTFIDATTLLIAEEYEVSHIITWNKKHFEKRTQIPLMTPEDFLALMPT